MLLPAGDISLPRKTNMRITPKRASLLSRLTCGHPFLAGGFALIAALGVQPLLTSAEKAGGRKIEVLFLGQEGETHPFDKSSAQLIPELAKEAINISYTFSPADLNAPNLAKFDAVLLYANYDSITPAQEKALQDFVNSGKGFVAVHSAAECFRNSAAYVRLVGGELEKHDTGTFTAPIVRPEHPVMQGVAPFEAADEK